MALITGSTGSLATQASSAFEEIATTTPIAAIQKWQANITNVFFDSAVFGSETVGDTWYRGRYTISGTAEGFLHGTNAVYTNFLTDFGLALGSGTSGTASMVLTASTGRTYTFPAMINDWNVSVSVEQGGPLNRVTFSFINSGAATPTTAIG